MMPYRKNSMRYVKSVPFQSIAELLSSQCILNAQATQYASVF